MRKGRSDVIDHKARHPTQERSQRRFDTILAATEELLQTANIEDISFYDIARKARISPASVHYLFPTMAAVRIEISKLYNQQSSGGVVEAQRQLAKMRNATWQEWIRIVAEKTRSHFNANRHICEVLLGPLLHRESRLANMRANDVIGRSLLENLRSVFLVPDIPGLEQKFVIISEIVDALWSRAYLLNGWIDDEAFEETVRVQIAYLRSVLPESLPLVRADAQIAPHRTVDASYNAA
ncbi:MAG TPA: TetR/AcrR family transcriptional regulator [Rhizomicrobium sp.]|jgi:AcrR family transcriptional regulator